MHGFDDPIDARITANGLMLRVDEDDLEIFVGRVLVDPVGVQHPQIGAPTSHAFFGSGLEGALVFQLVNTLVGGFAFNMLYISMCPKTRTDPLN